jgi:hypothetical protein
MSASEKKKITSSPPLLKEYAGYPDFRFGLNLFRNAMIVAGEESTEQQNTFLNTFILHDIRVAISALNFLRPALDSMVRSDPLRRNHTPEFWDEMDRYYAASRKGNALTLKTSSSRDALFACGDWVNAYNRLLQYFPANDEMVRDDAFIKSATAMARTWGLFHHSSSFLLGITSNNERQAARSYHKLESTTYSLSDVLDASVVRKREMVNCGLPISDTVNGIEALMIHNLLKNADRHAVSAIDIFRNGDQLVIQNDSHTFPDRSTLFFPGTPGVGGNTGFGLFTMKHIFGALGGYTLDLVSDESASQSLHCVSFAMTAPRQVSSSLRTR